MRVQTNSEALNTYRNFNTINRAHTLSLERLSSGFRINRAADDASGLAISEKMRGQIRALNRSVHNAQDGINLIQTAERAMIEIHNNLQRMRELAVQAATGSLTLSDRIQNQEEIQQLKDEIERIKSTTEFNTKKLLDGSTSALVSSSKPGTKVIMLDGLMVDDQYGQVAIVEGNYRLHIEAEAGVNQVQKSHIFQAIESDSPVTDSTPLQDVVEFWDRNGNFSLAEGQSITLLQGDGEQETITIYAGDTIGDLRDKLNSAIAHGLSQAELVDDTDRFVSFVEAEDLQEGLEETEGIEAVGGTLILRSAMAGEVGEISFLADDIILEAFGFMTIQESRENNYTVDVTEAHSGNQVVTGLRTSKNMLVGAVHHNVDVFFDSHTGVKAVWDEERLDWTLLDGEEYRSTEMIHISESTMVFHIGANAHQKIATPIGDLSTIALGVDTLQVISREAANRSIGRLDDAIGIVSSERSKLGALQNRLEQSIANLSLASESLTAAESRIRDVDMASTMMQYTKHQILLQAGTAMMAQANMRPMMVLQLLG